MSDSSSPQPFPIEGSSCYHFWLMERAEIDRVKWLESERLGYDIGADRAHFLWAFHGYRAEWINRMRAATGLANQS